MSGCTVVFDACVLYPAPLRDFLMHLALTDLFRAKWTNEIHEEWITNVLVVRPDLTRDKLERTRDLMNLHVKDCLVEDYSHLVPAIDLPDPKDRHVLAAAIRAAANLIITFNLKDFPVSELSKHAVEAQHPDTFVVSQLHTSLSVICFAAKQHRATLKRPAKSVKEYLETLERCGLPAAVAILKEHEELI